MIKDAQIIKYFRYLEKNGNLEKLTTNHDNSRTAIHRWFPFLAGFSHNLVSETLKFFEITNNKYTLCDPFMGSGTTGVVAKSLNVNVIGNESNPLLHKICTIKTNSFDNLAGLAHLSKETLNIAKANWRTIDISKENSLLLKCFPSNNLKKMVALRDAIFSNNSISEEQRGFLFLALTISLPKLSSVAINVPYVSWNCKRTPENTFSVFSASTELIINDVSSQNTNITSSSVKLYLHDSRKKNPCVKSKSIDMIFTSPPYLNNFDYGESLKVFLYFWKIANKWSEITDVIRKPSVTSSTTHYLDGDLSSKKPRDILGNDFFDAYPRSSRIILNKINKINEARKLKLPHRTKSFDTLTALYFKDMGLVLKEIKRVLKNDSLAFLVIGDSAPYGIRIATDKYLGKMALERGFSSIIIKPLRVRGTKWVTLKNRHNEKLRESLLILRR